MYGVSVKFFCYFYFYYYFVVKPLVQQAQSIKLIYAYGATDNIKYHGIFRGTKEVNLLNYMPKTVPPDARYLSVKVDKVSKKDSKLGKKLTNTQINNCILFKHNCRILVIRFSIILQKTQACFFLAYSKREREITKMATDHKSLHDTLTSVQTLMEHM